MHLIKSEYKTLSLIIKSTNKLFINAESMSLCFLIRCRLKSATAKNTIMANIVITIKTITAGPFPPFLKLNTNTQNVYQLGCNQ